MTKVSDLIEETYGLEERQRFESLTLSTADS